MVIKKMDYLIKGGRKTMSCVLLFVATQTPLVFADDDHVRRVQTFSGAVVYVTPVHAQPYVRHWQPVPPHYRHGGGHQYQHQAYPVWCGGDHRSHNSHNGHGYRPVADQFYRPDKNRQKDHQGKRNHGEENHGKRNNGTRH